MKLIIKFTTFTLLMMVLINISCKKELSCENCGANSPGSKNKPPIANAGQNRSIMLPIESFSITFAYGNNK